MRILVTGGAGFIGSHLTEKLILAGHHVLILDDFSTGLPGNLSSMKGSKELTITQGSILDKELVEELTNSCDYIFHLAAAVGVFNIVEHPLKSLITNVRGTENVLESAHKVNIPVLLTSSSEIYGKNTSDRLKETDDRVLGSPTTLRWSYSEAKAIDESLAHAYHKEHGLETRIVRFFNTVGPRQLANYGMVIPRFIEAARSGNPINIYGDGTQTRCFAHVDDVIQALLLIAFSSETVGRAVNVGNDFEISIYDLAKKVLSELKSNSEIIFVPYDQAYGSGFEDMTRRVPDLTLAKELTGWEPKKDLTTIIRDIANEMELRR